MNSILNKRKAMLLSSLLALGLMLPTGAAAQQQGGLFEHQDFGNGSVGSFTHQNFGNGNIGLFTHQTFGSGYLTGDFTHQMFGGGFTGDFTHQDFGGNAPTGSGLLVLTAAGAVYALRRRKDKQQNNE